MSIASLIPKGVAFRLGSSGPAVKEIQLGLRRLGYPLTGTSYFGNATDTAVEAFQKRAGLPVDGLFGKTTAEALDKALGSNLVETAPTAVKEIERPLWLQVSIDNIGLKEAPGSANNRELVADIRTVADDYQVDSTPWCAGWVSFCLSKAGQKPTSKPLWALSYSDTKNEPLVKLIGPAVGAIAVKTRSGGGHVTFVAGRTKGGLLACCGGNQNDMVNISEYKVGVFLGFYWPKSVPLPRSVGIMSLPIITSNGTVKSET